jgi:hypothetical protein
MQIEKIVTQLRLFLRMMKESQAHSREGLVNLLSNCILDIEELVIQSHRFEGEQAHTELEQPQGTYDAILQQCSVKFQEAEVVMEVLAKEKAALEEANAQARNQHRNLEQLYSEQSEQLTRGL